MEFRDCLKKDLERVGCSLSELSRASGLSSAVISRYRSGERIPRRDSDMLIRLCDGFAKLEKEAGIPSSGQDRLMRYRAAIDNKPSLLPSHLDELLKTLRLSMKDLSYILNYDASYLSRIRSGKRTPADPVAFANHIAKSLNETLRPADRLLVAELTGAESEENFTEALSNWLIQAEPAEDAQIARFLNAIDSFNLNEFIRSLTFESTIAEGTPIGTDTRCYYNTAGLRQGELDFFMSTLRSNSTGPIYMCNDMPMEEMASDIQFVKNWMGMIAMCLKKGHHIHIIHAVNRPFPEMMLGLETWIPVYMTGQISPYYLTSPGSSVYRHCTYVSDACFLSGEGIGGSSENAASILSGDPERIAYGKNRAKMLFAHAAPLMKIIYGAQTEPMLQQWNDEASMPGAWHVRANVPPFYAMTPDLLADILRENNSSPDLCARTEQFLDSHQEFIDSLLRTGTVQIEITKLSKAEFEQYTPEVDIPIMNPEEHLRYSWDTYQRHMTLAMEFAAGHRGLSMRETSNNAFRNLVIYVQEQKLAVVAKQKDPRITFVITHPNIVRAIRHFTAPVIEPEEED